MADNYLDFVIAADVYYEHPYTTQDLYINSTVARLQSWPVFPINSVVYYVQDASLGVAINSDVIGFNKVVTPINSRVREGVYNTVSDFFPIRSIVRVFGTPVKVSINSKVVAAPVTLQTEINSSILKTAFLAISMQSGVVKSAAQGVYINSLIKSLKESKFGFSVNSSVMHRSASVSVGIRSIVGKPSKVFNPVLMSFYTPKEMDW